MEKANENFILNQPPRMRRGLTINRNGRISLRSIPCKRLHINRGDNLVFAVVNNQMYLLKSDAIKYRLKLSGRPGQLHCNSTTTANFIMSHRLMLIPDVQEVDLVVSDRIENIIFEDQEFQALAVIERTDPKHCKTK